MLARGDVRQGNVDSRRKAQRTVEATATTGDVETGRTPGAQPGTSAGCAPIGDHTVTDERVPDEF